MSFIDILNTGVLALIMFSIGASMTIADVYRVLQQPKAPLLGLFLQMIFLPALGFGILLFSNLDPVLKAGIFIVTLCPGGTTSNFISYLVNADIALSVAMTTVNSLIILISIPLLANFGLGYFMADSTGSNVTIPIGPTVLQVFGVLLVPAILGLWFNRQMPALSYQIKQPLKVINVVLLALVFLIRGFGSAEQGGSGLTFEDGIAILPSALAIHLISMVGSYFIAVQAKFPRLQALTIGIEVGLQNTALALFVTGTMLANPAMTKPAIVFALFSFFTTLIFALIAKRGIPEKEIAHQS